MHVSVQRYKAHKLNWGSAPDPPGHFQTMKKEWYDLNTTSTYQLNQWDAADRILREDFNADNEKIDAALSAIQAAGLKIMTGSFACDGTTGTRTYSIGARPKLVLVRTDYTSANYDHSKGLLITDNLYISFYCMGSAYLSDPDNSCAITDDGFSITHSTTVLNYSGHSLYYWALC